MEMEHDTTTTTNNTGTTNNNWQASSCSSSQSSSSSSYYAQMEESINNKAQLDTLEYLRELQRVGGNRGGADQCHDQIFLVYKFINTPLELLIAGM
jgi:hypothetical protein